MSTGDCDSTVWTNGILLSNIGVTFLCMAAILKRVVSDITSAASTAETVVIKQKILQGNARKTVKKTVGRIDF